MKTKAELQAFLGDDCGLTPDKAAWILERDKGKITGFMITGENGFSTLVDRSAVRYITKEEWWELFHGKEGVK